MTSPRQGGHQRSPQSDRALAAVSVDPDSTLIVEIEAAKELDWQLDARMVRGSLDVAHIFSRGDSVHDGDVPNWVERVADVVVGHLEGSVMADDGFHFHGWRSRFGS